MPFRSITQRKFLFLKHPDIAKRWAAETPKGKKLPMYKSATKSKKNPVLAAAGKKGSIAKRLKNIMAKRPK